ncbi:MAG: DinB family protein [Candidatus Latescibacteria bacterium]|nr:DinB family protein [Candidatus Latescibacterota bacterium]
MPELSTAAAALVEALIGRGAHVESVRALEGMDWKLTGRRLRDAPHTIFQILNHIIFWQDFCLRRLRGEQVQVPPRAEVGWPGPESPHHEDEWKATTATFAEGLQDACTIARGPDLDEVLPAWEQTTRYEALRIIASHNSYHIGQIVLLRRMLGAWPPPGGGDTW